LGDKNVGQKNLSIEIKVLKTLATEKAYLELLPRFEQASGHRVTTRYGGTVDVRNWLNAGEPFDLAIAASSVIDAFTASGAIVPGSRVDVAASGVGVAVRKGAVKPDISTPEAFKSALLAAKSVGYSTGPSGEYFLRLLDRTGLSDRVRSKLRQIPAGGFVGTLVANGDADIGVQQVSELATFAGVDYIGPLPGDLQMTTIFAGGISTTAQQPEAARELVQFLAAPEAASTFRKFGLEPARR
jgi:molybdate transport system substrate-binding protein